MATEISSSTAQASSATHLIVNALTQAIVAHRLKPGTKLAEQKIASQFGVSRTLVRQALFQLSQHRLIRMEPARGAFVASPSVAEARQVFSVRRMLEAEMTRAFLQQVTTKQIKALQAHVKCEKTALGRDDTAARSERTELLGDFHVRMAELMGNQVLAELLNELISRCSLITLMYQSATAAAHSNDEHAQIVMALAAKDESLALRLMNEHLLHVEANLNFERTEPVDELASAFAPTP
jgi:DNA-binding GntR family transcriptional regulator